MEFRSANAAVFVRFLNPNNFQRTSQHRAKNKSEEWKKVKVVGRNMCTGSWLVENKQLSRKM